jgi:hypothetical protein
MPPTNFDFDPVSLLAGLCLGVFCTVLFMILNLDENEDLDN